MEFRSSARPRAVFVVLAALVAGCAGGSPPGEVAPADMAALEAQRAQTPNDPTLNLQLARGYYAAGRYADARAALAIVLAAQPGNTQAQAWLGLTYEARVTYDRLATAGFPRVRGRSFGRAAVDGTAHAVTMP